MFFFVLPFFRVLHSVQVPVHDVFVVFPATILASFLPLRYFLFLAPRPPPRVWRYQQFRNVGLLVVTLPLAHCSKKEWGVGDCERADRSQGTKKPIQSFTS